MTDFLHGAASVSGKRVYAAPVKIRWHQLLKFAEYISISSFATDTYSTVKKVWSVLDEYMERKLRAQRIMG